MALNSRVQQNHLEHSLNPDCRAPPRLSATVNLGWDWRNCLANKFSYDTAAGPRMKRQYSSPVAFNFLLSTSHTVGHTFYIRIQDSHMCSSEEFHGTILNSYYKQCTLIFYTLFYFTFLKFPKWIVQSNDRLQPAIWKSTECSPISERWRSVISTLLSSYAIERNIFEHALPPFVYL